MVKKTFLFLILITSSFLFFSCVYTVYMSVGVTKTIDFSEYTDESATKAKAGKYDITILDVNDEEGIKIKFKNKSNTKPSIFGIKGDQIYINGKKMETFYYQSGLPARTFPFSYSIEENEFVVTIKMKNFLSRNKLRPDHDRFKMFVLSPYYSFVYKYDESKNFIQLKDRTIDDKVVIRFEAHY